MPTISIGSRLRAKDVRLTMVGCTKRYKPFQGRVQPRKRGTTLYVHYVLQLCGTGQTCTIVNRIQSQENERVRADGTESVWVNIETAANIPDQNC